MADDKKPSNVVALNLSDPDEMRANLEKLKRNVEALVEYHIVVAELRRKSYEAHIAQGFTAMEALVLCQNLT